MDIFNLTPSFSKIYAHLFSGLVFNHFVIQVVSDSPNLAVFVHLLIRLISHTTVNTRTLNMWNTADFPQTVHHLHEPLLTLTAFHTPSAAPLLLARGVTARLWTRTAAIFVLRILGTCDG